MSISEEKPHSLDVPAQEETGRFQPFFAKKLPGLFSHWDSALLCLVVLALLVMVGNLLWPRPVASLKLRSLPTSTAVLETGPLEAGIPTEESSDSGVKPITKPKKSRRGVHAKKKPEKPPILNLNTATLEQLQLLPGIGPKMAERILEYRKTKGPFQTTEQIMDVKGIGAKKFEKLKPFLKI
jgi:competence ComEA-like helix-hairpin-helix protein